MSDFTEIKEMLIKQDKKLDDICFAIYGNKEAGIKGIAQIAEAHEKYINMDKKIKWMGAGLFASSGALSWEIIKKYFGL